MIRNEPEKVPDGAAFICGERCREFRLSCPCPQLQWHVVQDKSLPQSKPKIQELSKDLATKYGELLIVADQPKTSRALVIAVAQQLGLCVAG